MPVDSQIPSSVLLATEPYAESSSLASDSTNLSLIEKALLAVPGSNSRSVRRSRSPLKFLRQTFQRSSSPRSQNRSTTITSEKKRGFSRLGKVKLLDRYRRGQSQQFHLSESSIVEEGGDEKDEERAFHPTAGERLGIGASPFADPSPSANEVSSSLSREKNNSKHQPLTLNQGGETKSLVIFSSATATDRDLTHLVKGAYPDQYHHRSINHKQLQLLPKLFSQNLELQQQNRVRVVIPGNEVRENDIESATSEGDGEKRQAQKNEAETDLAQKYSSRTSMQSLVTASLLNSRGSNYVIGSAQKFSSSRVVTDFAPSFPEKDYFSNAQEEPLRSHHLKRQNKVFNSMKSQGDHLLAEGQGDSNWGAKYVTVQRSAQKESEMASIVTAEKRVDFDTSSTCHRSISNNSSYMEPKTSAKKQILWYKTRKESGQETPEIHTENDLSLAEPPSKIFLLLLAPRAKIFELIQLIYPPSTTTIGNILDMIPHNATETALASQRYKGLIRPESHARSWTDKNLIASKTASMAADTETAGIVSNELLIALPYEYATKYISRVGRQILNNPRIQGLLDITKPCNPLTSANSHRRSSSRSSSRSSRSSSKPRSKTQSKEPCSETFMSSVPEELPEGVDSPKSTPIKSLSTGTEGEQHLQQHLEDALVAHMATLSSVPEASESLCSTASKSDHHAQHSASPNGKVPNVSSFSNKAKLKSVGSGDVAGGLIYGCPGPFVEHRIKELEDYFCRASSFHSLEEYRSAVCGLAKQDKEIEAMAKAEFLASCNANGCGGEDVDPFAHGFHTLSQAEAEREAELFAKQVKERHHAEVREYLKLHETSAAVMTAGNQTTESSRKRSVVNKRSGGTIKLSSYLEAHSNMGSNGRTGTRGSRSAAASENSGKGTAYSMRSLDTAQNDDDSAFKQNGHNNYMPVFRHRTIGGIFDDDNISLDRSISSWSKSVDSSITHKSSLSGFLSLLQEQQLSLNFHQRHKQRKLARRMRRFVAVGFVVIFLMYMLDSCTATIQDRSIDDPLGFVGFVQLVMAFALLVKIQLSVKRQTEENQCPFLLGCSRYAERFVHRIPQGQTDMSSSTY